MYRTAILAALLIAGSLHAQDDLVRKTSATATDSTGYRFTTVVSTEATPVQNQASSGTCWSYATNSFLESEMIRNGGPAIHLSKIYTARRSYEDKADAYVRMHGSLNYGDGGEPHDVVNMYAKYGTMPEEAYTGLNYGTDKNQFAELQAMLKAMLDVVIKAPNRGKLTPVWKKAFSNVLDAYLGPVPETFTYKGKSYTPQSFAKEVVKLDPADYVEFLSMTTAPYYAETMMMVPDNWALQQAWNIPMEDMVTIIDHALKNGYSVAWGGDVSEPSFSWKNGIAWIPVTPADDLTKEQKEDLFTGPKPEMTITPELRQEAFDNYTTQDDHGMQITGIAKDQAGNEWYIVKNSWGVKNDHEGYLYMSKNFVRYKTTSFMVNRKGVPSGIMKKLK
ncbi:MAG: aminopeptidase [Flavobacteriales bacterium]|nr:aminopeptidase [Flavobacteriales bacterium]MCL4281603.1 aminopeptidase [Flavobacteriales bacterium]